MSIFAVSITSPHSVYVDLNDSTTYTLKWVANTSFVYAYEVMYREKGSDTWLTMGKITLTYGETGDPTNADYDLTQIRTATGLDFTDIEYKVRTYATMGEEDENGLEEHTGYVDSEIYTLVFKPETTSGEFSTYLNGEIQRYPMFDKVDTPNISVSCDGIKHIPLVNADSGIASPIKIQLDGSTKAIATAFDKASFTYTPYPEGTPIGEDNVTISQKYEKYENATLEYYTEYQYTYSYVSNDKYTEPGYNERYYYTYGYNESGIPIYAPTIAGYEYAYHTVPITTYYEYQTPNYSDKMYYYYTVYQHKYITSADVYYKSTLYYYYSTYNHQYAASYGRSTYYAGTYTYQYTPSAADKKYYQYITGYYTYTYQYTVYRGSATYGGGGHTDAPIYAVGELDVYRTAAYYKYYYYISSYAYSKYYVNHKAYKNEYAGYYNEKYAYKAYTPSHSGYYNYVQSYTIGYDVLNQYYEYASHAVPVYDGTYYISGYRPGYYYTYGYKPGTYVTDPVEAYYYYTHEAIVSGTDRRYSYYYYSDGYAYSYYTYKYSILA